MKRSEINKALKELEQMIETYRISLPPFCNFTPKEWASKGHDYDEVRDNMLGWDITDYGSGNFEKIGFSLITLRNGNVKMDKYTKSYAEKLLFLKEGQYSCNHFHWNKMEDIINRGGGVLIIRVYNSLADGSVDRAGDVRILTDGMERYVPAGTDVEITRGNSMTIYPGLYHLFTPKKGCGDLIVGEVSSINDDRTDNYFEEKRPRFIPVEEDVPVEVPLCNEYGRLLF